MLRDLMRELTQRLSKAFPQAWIYEEFVRKNFKRPGFFLEIKGMKAQREVGSRYFFSVDWEVKYYAPNPDAGDPRTIYRDLNNVALTLYEVLTIPGYLLSAMSHEIDDNVLVFSLTTSFYGELGEDPENCSEKMIEINLEME